MKRKQGSGGSTLRATCRGEEEFDETLRYFRRRIELLGIDLRLGQSPSAEELAAGGFDVIVVATGVLPRQPSVPGIDHAKGASYADLSSGARCRLRCCGHGRRRYRL
jgi:2,4-dienoyl-CoA reductase (NADPH2)